MRTILFRSVLAILLLGITWVLVARQLTLLIDRFWTIPVESLPATPLVIDGGTITIGGHPMTLGGPDYQRIPLPDGFDTPPGEGDELSFRRERSVLSWPTPLQFNFMTGHSPSWKRNVYFRLHWKRRSGKSLELLWRYEQWFYSSLGGWGSADGMTNQTNTGLVKVEVKPRP